jgi:hypothetical protein
MDNLELLKKAYELYHSKDYGYAYSEEMHLRSTIDSLYRNITKEQQNEFDTWAKNDANTKIRTFYK